jgi:hypothetical protein
MGTRWFNVFMTSTDEREFIREWSSETVWLVSQYVSNDHKLQRLSADLEPLTNESEFKTINGFGIVIPSQNPHLTILPDTFGGPSIDGEKSEMIGVARTKFWSDKMLNGSFGVNLWPMSTSRTQTDIKYLDDLWKKLKRWVTKNYVHLPVKFDGYVGPDAMRLASEGRRLIGLRSVYTIKRLADEYVVTPRPLTRND